MVYKQLFFQPVKFLKEIRNFILFLKILNNTISNRSSFKFRRTEATAKIQFNDLGMDDIVVINLIKGLIILSGASFDSFGALIAPFRSAHNANRKNGTIGNPKRHRSYQNWPHYDQALSNMKSKNIFISYPLQSLLLL